ncbi:concanavalin A-like lectin/glucanase domain-containing protein [Bisporella sp. PMI_857]|nr:concanavalin A-like lectin/glucanase domain-containing protein [Bisporella sp. PMI_857]
MLFGQSAAQTWSTCNPLTTSDCPANPALGKSIAIDFTQGSVNSFTALGNPTYDNNGVSFTVAKQGDAPQLISIFYIMFGKVEITMKAAPGAGIVSTLVLQSDDLDEIDMEWLGADDMEVQTNYFGKGDITTYNRGQFNPAANNQNQFITYTIEWTESQIIWKVGGTIIRVLTPDTADANQYPQSPMQVKFGAWSGGDSSNPSGTIDWARGPTNYANGPFTMLVKSLSVTDYSTGTEYSYGDQSGDWTSIQAKGGAVNGNAGGKAATVTGADVPAATSASPSIPAGLGDDSNGNTATRTGWPWVASPTTATTEPTYTGSTAGIPAGWIITSEGKVVPASSAAVKTVFSGRWPSASTSSGLTPASETITGWDDRGFGTTITRPSSFSTIVKSYNDQGCE